MSLAPEQMTAIAAYLGLGEEVFIERYMRLNQARTGLALQDQSDVACVFLDGGDCRIQPVKPQQCRDFPNLWKYPGAEKYCRAIPRNVSEDEYVRLVSAATQRTPEDVQPEPEVQQNSPLAEAA